MAEELAPRPMRRKKREVTDADELRSIFERARTAHIGFTDDEGMAIVPMNYGFDWQGPEGSDEASHPTCVLWLHSATEGRKASAWTKSPEVAIELEVEHGVTAGDYACAYSYAYESIMARGTVARVDDPADKLHGLERIMAHMAPGAPVAFSDEAVARVAVWRVDVTRLTGKRREAQVTPKEARAAGDDERVPSPDTHVGDAPAEPAGEATAANEITAAVNADEVTAATIAEKSEGKPSKKDGHKGKKHGKKDKEGKMADKDKEKDKKDKKKLGLLEKIESKLKGKDKDEDLKKKQKADRKAREKAVEEVLKGQRCDGCGHHCKLSDPRCGKGKKLREKRLAKAGLR